MEMADKGPDGGMPLVITPRHRRVLGAIRSLAALIYAHSCMADDDDTLGDRFQALIGELDHQCVSRGRSWCMIRRPAE